MLEAIHFQRLSATAKEPVEPAQAIIQDYVNPAVDILSCRTCSRPKCRIVQGDK